jgi:8-oxo-dGTP pyrophosphatase MutT (NUDIX family)
VTEQDDQPAHAEAQPAEFPGAPVVTGPWTRRARSVAYENPWVTVWHDDVTRPDGQPGIYGVVHFRNAAVGIVALDEDDRLLLVGQHRYTLNAYSWEIPEGGVGPDENPVEGARRELREETGVEAAEWAELARYDLSNSVTDEGGVVFLATALTEGPADPEPTEDLAIRWVPFAEALAMTIDGRITDAISIIGIQRVALARLAAAAEAAAAGQRRL